MMKDQLIENLHSLFRQDEYIQEIFNSAGITLDTIQETIVDIEKQYWIDTATWGLDIWESILNIKSNMHTSIDDRRSLVEAKWKGDGKADIYLLQVVANSWRNGNVKVDFVEGKIKLTFNGIYGVPNDLQTLKDAIEDVKPAHLAVIYAFAYLLIKDIDGIMNLEQIESQTIEKFAF